MCQLILNWLYDNAVAIIISALASLFISHIYYCKSNRNAVLITVILPIIKILDRDFYKKKNYIELSKISSTYAVKYLRKKEREALYKLLSDYKDASTYKKNLTDTDSIMAYFEQKLIENKMNPKQLPINDNDENIVAFDYSQEYIDLRDYIYKIVSDYDFDIFPEEFENKIANIFCIYVERNYGSKKITFFKDLSIGQIIESSDVSKEWDKKFDSVEKSKNEFLSLPICKKVINIINETKLNEYDNNTI